MSPISINWYINYLNFFTHHINILNVFIAFQNKKVIIIL